MTSQKYAEENLIRLGLHKTWLTQTCFKKARLFSLINFLSKMRDVHLFQLAIWIPPFLQLLRLYELLPTSEICIHSNELLTIAPDY